MSWATDIAKKKQNAQGQALNRTSFDALFGSAGVTGQQGGVQAQASPTPQSSAADEGVKADNTPINYGSGVGLIPGTAAYAEWQKSQGGGVTPDGGPIREANPAGTTDPPEPAPAPASVYNVSTGRGSFTVDRAAIDNIVNTLPPNVQSAVKGMLASGNISLGGDTLRQLVNAGVPISTLMQLQKAIKQGTGMTKQDWMGGKLGNMNSGRNFENYRPGWMQKRIDRNMAAWEAEQQPQAPAAPNMPGYIMEDKLPPGYTPINGTYDPQTGLPMVSQAVGPDGSVWGVGPDGMPIRLGGQAPTVVGADPGFFGGPDNPMWHTVDGFGTPGGTVTNPGFMPYNPAQQLPPNFMAQLPPEMMNYVMSQLPYFNMYMNGMYGQ